MIINKISRWLKYYSNNKKLISARKTLIESLDSNPIPPLTKNLIKNTKVYKNRLSMLKNHLPNGSVCAEIGIAKGDFSKNILTHKKPANLHLIELSSSFVKHCENRFKKEISDGQVIIHNGSSHKILNQFENQLFDWVYIDGDHSYETVKKDLLISKNKIKPNGLIMLDDYVNFSHQEMLQYGVMRAVNEFCIEHDFCVDGITISEDIIKKENIFNKVVELNEYTNIVLKKMNNLNI